MLEAMDVAVRPRGDCVVHSKEYRHGSGSGSAFQVSGPDSGFHDSYEKNGYNIVLAYNARNGKVKTAGFLGLTGQADLMSEFQTKDRWCS